jgi:hypothetical protein
MLTSTLASTYADEPMREERVLRAAKGHESAAASADVGLV